MPDSEIGRRVRIHANAVIGSDGFGYELVDGRHEKVPQIGRTVIGDDVEIGAGTTIDRARFGQTVIGEGTKIDNLVQIGHNVIVGRHCILCGQVGVSGSVVIEDYRCSYGPGRRGRTHHDRPRCEGRCAGRDRRRRGGGEFRVRHARPSPDA